MFDTLWYSLQAGAYAYFDKGKLWAYGALAQGERVYRAKVVRRAAGLAGAFADVGGRRVLVRCEGEPLPQEGDHIYVWEAEPPKEGKLAVCRLHPTLAAELAILVPDGREVRFAKGVPEAVREAYRQRIGDGVGCIVRSAATLDNMAQTLRQIEELTAIWSQIKAHVGVGLVYQAPQDHAAYMREAREVVCDDQTLCARYGARYDVDVGQRIAQTVVPEVNALCAEVATPEGVRLVIEHTEACWVIDVNSGTFAANMPYDAYAYAVNAAAVREVVRQLCLRDVSGAIVVDFVNMSAPYRAKLMQLVAEEAAKDRRLKVVDMTKLGLVEMTRSAK